MNGLNDDEARRRTGLITPSISDCVFLFDPIDHLFEIFVIMILFGLKKMPTPDAVEAIPRDMSTAQIEIVGHGKHLHLNPTNMNVAGQSQKNRT